MFRGSKAEVAERMLRVCIPPLHFDVSGEGQVKFDAIALPAQDYKQAALPPVSKQLYFGHLDFGSKS